jgi:hypothetical protein
LHCHPIDALSLGATCVRAASSGGIHTASQFSGRPDRPELAGSAKLIEALPNGSVKPVEAPPTGSVKLIAAPPTGSVKLIGSPSIGSVKPIGSRTGSCSYRAR